MLCQKHVVLSSPLAVWKALQGMQDVKAGFTVKVYLLWFQVPVMITMRVYFCFQAQLQRSLDSSVSSKPRPFIGRRSRREQAASTDSSGRRGSQALEQDSGILDVEDDEEDDEVRKVPLHTETRASIHLTLFNREVVLRFEISLTSETLPRYTGIGKQRQLFNFFLFNSIHSCFSRKQWYLSCTAFVWKVLKSLLAMDVFNWITLEIVSCRWSLGAGRQGGLLGYAGSLQSFINASLLNHMQQHIKMPNYND